MNDSVVKFIGLYSVPNNPDVTLIELIINKKADAFDLIEFTQEAKNLPRSSWQVPFSEKYLSLDGESIIGDDFKLPKSLTDVTRLTFFIYFLDSSKPLITPFGHFELPGKQKQPDRIKALIEFESPE